MHKRRLRLPRDDVRESGTGSARTLAGLRTGRAVARDFLATSMTRHSQLQPSPQRYPRGTNTFENERESDIDQHSDKRVLREPEGRGVAAKSRV